MSKALLVIDIQNDYFPGGAMELVGSVEAAQQAALIQESFRKSADPVVHVQHVARSTDATFFLPNTWGAEINELVFPVNDEAVIVKHFPNAFRETNLLELFKSLSVDELTIVGMMTHMCIDTTVRAANDMGFDVTLIGDACATRNLVFEDKEVSAAQVQAAYLAAIDGSFATVVSAEKLLGLI